MHIACLFTTKLQLGAFDFADMHRHLNPEFSVLEFLTLLVCKWLWRSKVTVRTKACMEELLQCLKEEAAGGGQTAGRAA